MAKRDDGWKSNIRTGGGAEAWGYFSRSRESLEIYVRPVDESGDPVLPNPVKLRVYAKWFKQTKRGGGE